MKKIRKVFLGILVLASLLCVGTPAYAEYTCDSESARVKSGGSAQVKSPAECAQPKEERTVGGSVTQIINVVLSVLGIIAVLVIVIAGIMYATSTGDAGRVNKAKSVIQYALIGLIVAGLAWAIVNFVIAGVFSGSS